MPPLPSSVACHFLPLQKLLLKTICAPCLRFPLLSHVVPCLSPFLFSVSVEVALLEDVSGLGCTKPSVHLSVLILLGLLAVLSTVDRSFSILLVFLFILFPFVDPFSFLAIKYIEILWAWFVSSLYSLT